MRTTSALIKSVLVIGLVLALCFVQRIAVAQKASVPKPQDPLVLGEDEVKQLLLLIDADNTGKITKRQWMQFMEKEFDRLDKNRSGALDAKELAQSRLRVSPFPKVGK